MLARSIRAAKLHLVCDACDGGAGAALEQLDNGVRRSLALFSKRFSRLESLESTYDRELPAIYLVIKKFQ